MNNPPVKKEEDVLQQVKKKTGQQLYVMQITKSSADIFKEERRMKLMKGESNAPESSKISTSSSYRPKLSLSPFWMSVVGVFSTGVLVEILVYASKDDSVNPLISIVKYLNS